MIDDLIPENPTIVSYHMIDVVDLIDPEKHINYPIHMIDDLVFQKFPMIVITFLMSNLFDLYVQFTMI